MCLLLPPSPTGNGDMHIFESWGSRLIDSPTTATAHGGGGGLWAIERVSPLRRVGVHQCSLF